MSVCLQNYCLGVQPNAGTSRAPDGSYYVTMPGDVVPYSIRLENRSAERTNAYLSVDGRSVGTFRLQPGQAANVERPAYSNQQFTFFATGTQGAAAAGIAPGDPVNGLVSCRYVPELQMRVMPSPVYEPPRRFQSRSSASAAPEAMSVSTSSAPPGAREGGTGLSGSSDQVFLRAKPMIEDPSAAVTITLRLVAPPQQYTPVPAPVTPLPGRTPIPPPVYPPSPFPPYYY